MGLRLSLLKTVEAARKLSGPTFADIRQQLTIRTRVWSGGRLNRGVPTDTDLVLPAHYPIRYLNAQEISSSAGQYEVGDILVDHITPSDGAGTGYTLAQLLPEVLTNDTEIIYVVSGTHPGEYTDVDVRTYRPFTFQLVLRRKASTP